MANEGKEEPKGPVFEHHTADEMRQFTRGTHQSQQPGSTTGPKPGAGATGPKPGDTATGPKPGDANATGPKPGAKPEEVLSGIFPADDPREQELTNLRAKVKQYEEKPPDPALKSDKLYKLQVIENETPNEAPIYWKYLSGNLDSIELWKLGFLKDNPEYVDKPEEVNMYLAHKFPALFGDNVDKTSNEYRIAKMDFDLESKKVRASLDSRLNQIQRPKPEEPGKVGDQERTDLVGKWKPEFVTIAGEPDNVKITVPVSDGVSEEIEFALPLESKKKVFEDAAMFVLNGKLQPGAETVKSVKDFMRQRIIAYHFNDIAAGLIKQAVQKRDEEWKKATGNNVRIENVTTKKEKTVADPQQAFVEDVIRKTEKK